MTTPTLRQLIESMKPGDVIDGLGNGHVEIKPETGPGE